jgi:hypothetical protein
MERGIIAAPGIIDVQGTSFKLARSISPQELRYYALYWDKVIIPGTNLVNIAIPEEDVLIQTGVLSRPKVHFSGSYNGEEIENSFAVAQSLIAKKLISEEKNVDWVVHQIGNNLTIPNNFITESRTLHFDLINVLPVPSADVPISDIIEFKERRCDELTNLHNSLDEAYIEILNSPNKTLKNNKAVTRLKDAISSIDSVTAEEWKKETKFDFSAELNIDEKILIKGIAASAIFEFFTNAYTIPIGTIVGGAASFLKLKAKVSSTFEPAKNKLKLGYLAHAHEERML